MTDHSSATQTSLNIASPRRSSPGSSPQDCSADTYAPSDTLTPAQTTFDKGDRICFELTATFRRINATVNPTWRTSCRPTSPT